MLTRLAPTTLTCWRIGTLPRRTGGQMASGQRSPLREKAEWLLRFAGMSLATPRDFRRLRLEAHRWLDPDGARPLELGELRDVQAHIQRGLKAAFIAVKRQEHCIDCAKAVQKARVAAWRRRNAQRVRGLAHETYVAVAISRDTRLRSSH